MVPAVLPEFPDSPPLVGQFPRVSPSPFASNLFFNRSKGGKELARLLKYYAYQPDTIVVALSRKGAVVAHEVSTALNLPLHIFSIQKIPCPNFERLPLGIITSGNELVLCEEIVGGMHIPNDALYSAIENAKQTIQTDSLIFKDDDYLSNLSGQNVILIDDQIIKGDDMRGAVAALKRLGPPRKLVVASPVCGADSLKLLSRHVDDIIVCTTPQLLSFTNTSYYSDDDDLNDNQIAELLSN